jgi:hypothetical protein
MAPDHDNISISSWRTKSGDCIRLIVDVLSRDMTTKGPDYLSRKKLKISNVGGAKRLVPLQFFHPASRNS